MDLLPASSKAKRFMPIISIFLVCPIWAGEDQISFIHKKQKEMNLEEISFGEPLFNVNSKHGDGLIKLSKIREKLIETKKLLVEKEKQLVIKSKELLEKEQRLIARERRLLFREREFQQHQTAQSEVQAEILTIIPEEPKIEQSYFAQEDQQYTEAQVQPSNKAISEPPTMKREEQCRSPFHIMHLGLRHTEGGGVGYNHGYTTLEGFGIYDRTSAIMPFLDLRGHLFDDGKWAGNAGIGFRSYLSSINHVLGAYLYYDIREAGHGLTAQELSPGLELLGRRMEYRINGYFPISDQQTGKYDFRFDQFDGNRILLKSKQKRVLTGGDAEVGVHLTQSTKYDVYAGAGPYYFTTSRASAWGGKVRLLGRYKQYISVEASYSYDHLFGNVVQGSIALNAPFGNKIRRKGKNCSDRVNLALGRAAFAPYRVEIPVVKTIKRKETAINPATSRPWKVWFVDNTSSSSGTFKSPFPTLVQAQNASSQNEIIYVFPGDGTTTGMDAGITLKNLQKLWGSAISHPLATTRGNIKVPAFSSRTPSITNFAGNGVDLANQNEVSGMNILAATAGSSGIFGAMGTNGATITDNVISGSVDHHGIFVFQGHGKYIVENNQLTASGMNTLRGIRITSSDRTFTKGTISNNDISGYSIGMSFGPGGTTFLSNGKYTIEQNTISDFQTGIIVGFGFVDGKFEFLRNTFNNNRAIGGDAIFFSLGNTAPNINFGKVIFNENTIHTATPLANNAILLEVNDPVGSFLKAHLDGNKILVGTAAGSTGVTITATSNNTLCATITGNEITLQSPGTTNDLKITTVGTGIVNIDVLSGNSGANSSIMGNVHFVPEGTCN